MNTDCAAVVDAVTSRGAFRPFDDAQQGIRNGQHFHHEDHGGNGVSFGRLVDIGHRQDLRRDDRALRAEQHNAGGNPLGRGHQQHGDKQENGGGRQRLCRRVMNQIACLTSSAP